MQYLITHDSKLVFSVALMSECPSRTLHWGFPPLDMPLFAAFVVRSNFNKGFLLLSWLLFSCEWWGTISIGRGGSYLSCLHFTWLGEFYFGGLLKIFSLCFY